MGWKLYISSYLSDPELSEKEARKVARELGINFRPRTRGFFVLGWLRNDEIGHFTVKIPIWVSKSGWALPLGPLYRREPGRVKLEGIYSDYYLPTSHFP